MLKNLFCFGYYECNYHDYDYDYDHGYDYNVSCADEKPIKTKLFIIGRLFLKTC